jgi:PAT family beta-lactamase induction signal transducer AmpG
VLPRPLTDQPSADTTAKNIVQEFFRTFISFFQKKHAWIGILFMLLYRLPEAQLVKIINPFLLDPLDKGGMGLSTSEVGFVYGTIGIIGLTIGGIIGGICASKGGLKRWLWPMALSLVLPNLVYVLLSIYQPQNISLIISAVFIEQFGYGFGFTAYMLYLIHFSRGTQATAHYAICTAFMALGMMLPGMAAGWLQETLGYVGFFTWVMVCCVATLIVCALVKKEL